jgi:hypothetical protein
MLSPVCNFLLVSPSRQPDSFLCNSQSMPKAMANLGEIHLGKTPDFVCRKHFVLGMPTASQPALEDLLPADLAGALKGLIRAPQVGGIDKAKIVR